MGFTRAHSTYYVGNIEGRDLWEVGHTHDMKGPSYIAVLRQLASDGLKPFGMPDLMKTIVTVINKFPPDYKDGDYEFNWDDCTRGMHCPAHRIRDF